MNLKGRVTATCGGLDSEDLYFQQHEQENLKKLREDCEKHATEEYCADHKLHCFRCGTESLAEVDHGGIKIDVCVNKGCGAVHLDPGELDLIEGQENPGSLKKVQDAVFSIFK